MVLSVEDRLLLHELYARYNLAFDDGDADTWAALFTDDGVFATSRVISGREGLLQLALERSRTRDEQPVEHVQHWNNNILLERDGEIVRGRCYLIRVARDRATGELSVITLGQYRDEIVQVDGQWRFARRTATP